MRTLIKEVNQNSKEKVNIQGWVFRVRKLKKFSFVIIRDYSGYIQCFLDHNIYHEEISLESAVSLEGYVSLNKNDYADYEIQITSLIILNKATSQPMSINQIEIDASLDTILNHRAYSLRHQKNQAIFNIQNTISNTFRDFLRGKDFHEIHSPKIVSQGAEGGTDVFALDYFGQLAYLSQSPQFYKQMMVASFERVYEISQVYRAEKHNTSRHLNEYVSMDLELGFIDDEHTLMDLEEQYILYLLETLLLHHQNDISLFSRSIPTIKDKIPRIPFRKAIQILKQEYGKENDFYDLEPESERLLCLYAKEKYQSDFIFITHYPRAKRPMYTMPFGEEETHSFDLLFNGTEITTGGIRIHDYQALKNNMLYFGVDPNKFPMYLEVFTQGIPPHGGFALGLERVTIMLLGLKNIREASLFPRDCTRLLP